MRQTQKLALAGSRENVTEGERTQIRKRRDSSVGWLLYVRGYERQTRMAQRPRNRCKRRELKERVRDEPLGSNRWIWKKQKRSPSSKASE